MATICITGEEQGAGRYDPGEGFAVEVRAACMYRGGPDIVAP